MRLEQHFSQFVQPATPVTREAVAREVEASYRGHVAAEAEKYKRNPAAIDQALGGPGVFLAIADSCYDYAMEGQLKTTGIGIQDDNWLDFASFIYQARNDDEFHSANSLAPTLEKLFYLGAVRARLDIETLGEPAEAALPTILQDNNGYLTLFEVAVLAQMIEKSVRNATQPTAPDRLLTRKEGSRTVVDCHEALRWLKGRRNFKPTVLM